jgi:hypothetical protein
MKAAAWAMALAVVLAGCGPEAPPVEVSAPGAPPPGARITEPPGSTPERPAAEGLLVLVAEAGPHQSFQAEWGDLDGDGKQELAVANIVGPDVVLALRDGALVELWRSTVEQQTEGVAWLDADDDGDLDLATACFGCPNRLYLNRAGQLEEAWVSDERSRSKDVAAADVDGDGDLDLVVANEGPNELYRNDDGRFVLTWRDSHGEESDAVALADVDGDGDLDLAVANSGGAAPVPDRLYTNEGGVFEPAWAAPDVVGSSCVGWADLDGDGDPDLAMSRPEAPDVVYRNDGGRLVQAWASAEARHTRELAWGDVDGDGDPDLVYSVEGGVELYLNDGGRLSLGWTGPETRLNEGVALGDGDGDGRLELAVVGWDPDREEAPEVPIRIYGAPSVAAAAAPIR